MKKIVKKRTGGKIDPSLQKKRDRNIARVNKNNSKGTKALGEGNTKKAHRKFDKADKLDERRVKFTERKKKALKKKVPKKSIDGWSGNTTAGQMKTGGPTTKTTTNKRGTTRSITLPDFSKGRRHNRKAVATATKTKKNGKSVTISTTGIGKGKGHLGAHTKTKTKKDGTTKIKKITLKKAGKAINKADKKIDALKRKKLYKAAKTAKPSNSGVKAHVAPKRKTGGTTPPSKNGKFSGPQMVRPKKKVEPEYIIKNGKIHGKNPLYVKKKTGGAVKKRVVKKFTDPSGGKIKSVETKRKLKETYKGTDGFKSKQKTNRITGSSKTVSKAKGTKKVVTKRKMPKASKS